MKRYTPLFCFVFVTICALFSCIFPYPIFSSHTNITESEFSKISNFYETELSQIPTQITPTILNLNWKTISLLLSFEEKYEIIDLTSDNTFFVTIIGGKNHLDIVPANDSDLETMKELCHNQWTWQTCPVLFRYNEDTYFPASLTLYPHGFSENNPQGHFCLHFKDSKTHRTNHTSQTAQQTIKTARKLGKQFLSQNQ